MENTKYFGKTLSRKWLVVQIPLPLLDLTLEHISDDESNRYKHLSIVFASALKSAGHNITDDEVFQMFADGVSHSTKDSTDEKQDNASASADGFVLEATTDSTEEAKFKKLLDDVQAKINIYQKQSGKVPDAKMVTASVEAMNITAEEKAYLLLKLVSKKPELVF